MQERRMQRCNAAKTDAFASSISYSAPIARLFPHPLSSHVFLWRRIPFRRLVSAVVLLLVGPADLRLCDHAVAPDADEIVHAHPSPAGVLLEKPGQSGVEGLDDVRADRMIEHRRRADLDRSASQQTVVERVLEAGAP